jgi:hypothetical protein
MWRSDSAGSPPRSPGSPRPPEIASRARAALERSRFPYREAIGRKSYEADGLAPAAGSGNAGHEVGDVAQRFRRQPAALPGLAAPLGYEPDEWCDFRKQSSGNRITSPRGTWAKPVSVSRSDRSEISGNAGHEVGDVAQRFRRQPAALPGLAAPLGHQRADLAVAAALVSSLSGTPLPSEAVYFGEVGLSGAIRPVAQAPARLKEAHKLGFHREIGRRLGDAKPPRDVEVDVVGAEPQPGMGFKPRRYISARSACRGRSARWRRRRRGWRRRTSSASPGRW